MSNLAQVHIELGNYCHALVHAQNGLELDPTHVKCLYRCGVANRHLGNYENALHALQKAKQLVGFYKSSSKLPARMNSAGAHKTENGDGNINTCAVTSLPSTTCALSLLMAWDMRESYMLAIFSRYKGLQRPIMHLTFVATSVSWCAWCSHHENLHGMSALFASSILLARHAESTMQNPEDCAIKEELANAEDSGSHNTMANYVGPLKVINIPGTSSPATPPPVI